MSALDLAIRGGTVVAPDGVARADVGVADGRIVAVAEALEAAAGEEVDATGLHVLPGAVDAHVHFNDPGRADTEGYASGTRACAAGGTTTVVDMPLNALPPTIDARAFDAKVAAATGAAHVDFALWGGLVPGPVDRLDELAGRGVVGFKAFMSDTGTPEFARADDLTLYEGMRCAAAWVASDHSPSLPEAKAGDDFFALWGGITGCQVLLGALLDAGHHERGVALARITELAAAGAARRLRLPGKGRVEAGADADLALVDLPGGTVLGPDTLLHRHAHSPWAGRVLRGRIVRTLVRGTTVFADGRVAGPPAGRLVTPETTEET
jgi:dihydroorotase-like cyclic amidohydrolase